MDYKDRKNTVVILGSDHAGYQAKSHAIEYLKGMGYSFLDLGTQNQDRVDYPDFGIAVAKKVSCTQNACGIIFCGTGIGISITANKVKGIRAALCTNEYQAEMARKHNNANILAMGGRITTFDIMDRIMKVWFSTEFEGGRHTGRVKKIHSLSEK